MIPIEQLENLATLARIKLSDADKISLQKEFDSILGYVDQLKKVPVSMDEEGRVGAVKNVFRGDTTVTSSPEDRKRLIDSAPDHEGEFVAVKKMIS
jgi:aspartyl/glutamyl-tRNA(Asn/Gln) amidotransferase C subunit